MAKTHWGRLRQRRLRESVIGIIVIIIIICGGVIIIVICGGVIIICGGGVSCSSGGCAHVSAVLVCPCTHTNAAHACHARKDRRVAGAVATRVSRGKAGCRYCALIVRSRLFAGLARARNKCQVCVCGCVCECVPSAKSSFGEVTMVLVLRPPCALSFFISLDEQTVHKVTLLQTSVRRAKRRKRSARTVEFVTWCVSFSMVRNARCGGRGNSCRLD
jgi:hypothetical protein